MWLPSASFSISLAKLKSRFVIASTSNDFRESLTVFQLIVMIGWWSSNVICCKVFRFVSGGVKHLGRYITASELHHRTTISQSWYITTTICTMTWLQFSLHRIQFDSYNHLWHLLSSRLDWTAWVGKNL